jgi:hypothetical protein
MASWVLESIALRDFKMWAHSVPLLLALWTHLEKLKFQKLPAALSLLWH